MTSGHGSFESGNVSLSGPFCESSEHSLTCSGRLADLNQFVVSAGIRYFAGKNFVGNDSVVFNLTDHGSSGIGFRHSLRRRPLEVWGVNDAPQTEINCTLDCTITESSGEPARLSARIHDPDALGRPIDVLVESLEVGLLAFRGALDRDDEYG